MNGYEVEQKKIQIGSTTIGGEPGESPIVAVGTVFYANHKALLDEKTGDFNKDMVEAEINEFLSIADETGMSVILDVVGSYPDALIKECSYIADLVDVPFLVDGLNDDIRVPAMKGLAELGLLDRAILNSIEDSTSEENIQQLKEIGVKHAVLLTFGSRYILPKQKIQLLEERLIPKAKKAGIENMIVDTAVLDLPSISINFETTNLVKNKFGLPTGYAPANAIYAWNFGKEFGDQARCGAIASIMTNCLDSGCDFVLYGPVKFAKCILPSLALVSATKSYYRKRILRKTISEKNPISKIF